EEADSQFRFQAIWTWTKRGLDEEDGLTAGPDSPGCNALKCMGGIMMRRKACAVLLFVLLLGTEAVPQDWPALPKEGFISGRAAPPADVAAGNAAFSASVGGGAVGKSTPLKIRIPQYAYYKEGGTKIPVIVLQAERIDVQKQSGELVQMT